MTSTVTMTGACACMGPPGDCPCLRKARGQKVEITETFIAPDIFATLSDEDKNTINAIKQKAFFTWFAERKSSKNETQATS
jgi:hypothetical protein